ncbi:MAG TPA: tetratricopeptide repeat protein [Thermomicrobiales bacterium]|jgi:predicted ATPase/DNA-binding XRE family transcriptional regulator
MAAQTTPTFAGLLREFRERAGLTQEELAERAELSTDAIGLLERGARQRPQHHTVQRLSAALELADDDRARLAAAARLARPGAARAATAPVYVAPPPPPTTFVGRAAALGDLTRLLDDPAVRLITLTGPGGVGKTRLALELAVRLADRFAAGIAFVPLASLQEPDGLLGAIARTLGSVERGDRTPLATLTAQLRDRDLLLILDNCEHLLAAAASLADLSLACPQLVVLVTSRAPLRLRAERQYPVAPLPLPNRTDTAPWESLADHPAIALFTQRSQAVAPNFALTPTNGAAVAAICRRLDGLPLALELAAVWSKILLPAALLARLERALPLLTDGPRDLPARHRTLRDTIAWSHDLLAPREQTLLRRLAVFAGDWSLAAAEAVCADPTEDTTLLPTAILPTLATLIDASLVDVPPAASTAAAVPRYSQLATIREYAAARLRESGEEEPLRHRHADYFLALAEEAQGHLVGAEEAKWLALLDAESVHLHAAVDWTIARRMATQAVRFAAVLWRFWAARGYLGEGHHRLGAILALAAEDTSTPPLHRAMLLHVTANLTRSLGDYPRAQVLYAECLAIRREHHDQKGILGALHNLGLVAHEQGDGASALRLHTEALALARALDDRYGIAYILATFGETIQASGDLDHAAAHYAESLAVFREIAHTWGIALALTRLGDIALARGNPELAAAQQRESLALSATLGDPSSSAEPLEGLAAALASTEPALAARLFGAAATLRDHLGIPRPAVRRALHEQRLAATRVALGETAFAAARAAGAALTLDDTRALIAATEH